MEEEGIYYFFEHSASGHTLVLADDASPISPCSQAKARFSGTPGGWLEEDVITPQQADDTRLEARALAASLARAEAQIASVDVDLRKSLLRAPFAGEIALRHVDPGVVVPAGHSMTTLTVPSELMAG